MDLCDAQMPLPKRLKEKKNVNKTFIQMKIKNLL